ncbi:hypothetical protein [Sinomonas soli]
MENMTRVIFAGFYGDYAPGDTASIPYDEARSLIRQGKARADDGDAAQKGRRPSAKTDSKEG